MSTETALSLARTSLEDGRSLAKLAIPKEIARSWYRCRQMGLDPRSAPMGAEVSEAELRALRQARDRQMRIVRPELELLSAQITGTNFMCAFADQDGVVLEAIMDRDFKESKCARSVRPGTVWREELRGTNALGLALLTGRTSIVTGREHYFASHGEVSCVSVPIYASDGTITGLLDASSEVADRQLHTAALVKVSALNIENRLFIEGHQNDFIIQIHPKVGFLGTQNAGMIAVDQTGRITGKNRATMRFLSTESLAVAGQFSDLFRGDVRGALDRLNRGETVQLWDRMNVGVFAQLLPGGPPGWDQAKTPSRILSRPPRQPRPTSRPGLVWEDEMVRDCLRVAKKAAELRQPVCIRGAPGTGKTVLVRMLHDHIHADRPLTSIDFRSLPRGSEGVRILANRLEPLQSDATLDAGGTLVLEAISAMDGAMRAPVDRVFARLQDSAAQRAWCVLATDRVDRAGASEQDAALAGWKMLVLDLPPLSHRTDFDKIAQRGLAEMSPDQTLSTKALRRLAQMDRPDNLSDLQHHLKVLAASCTARVLRDTHVDQVFPQKDDDIQACSKCRDTPIRRQRCLEIRRTFRACKFNVALTARRLGVSRNTVYAHSKD